MPLDANLDVGTSRRAAALDMKAAALLAWEAFQGLLARNGIEISGYIAFTIMLALFPFLIFLVSVAGFFGETETGENFITTLSLFAPPDMVDTLQPAIRQVIQNRSGSLLTIGLALALYSAGSGVAALRLALDLSYGVPETRSFWLRKAQDFLIVLVGSAVAILASALIILEPFILKIVSWFIFVDSTNLEFVHIARYAFALGIIFLTVIALHRVLPNARLSFGQILPGAITTTLLWGIAAASLNLYFGRFANYASTYGSLGGVIITLMFFYVSGIIFIYGGELNAALLARTAEKAPIKPESRSSEPISALSPQP